MERIKYALLINVLCLRRTVFGDCILDRNEYNKYPFVLKLVVDNVMLCHGSLITSKFFIAPFEPIKEVSDLTKLNIIGQLYGERGLLCFAIRQPKYLLRTEELGRDLNSMIGSLETGFEVTMNKPYLYTQLESLDRGFMSKKNEDIEELECCIIPVFESVSVNATILERQVTCIGNEGPTAEFWKSLFCNRTQPIKSSTSSSQTADEDPQLDNGGKCHDDVTRYNFFVYDPIESEIEDFNWQRGATLFCNDYPQDGIITSQLVDPATSTRVTVFEFIEPFVQLLHDEAMVDWPTSAPINATTSGTTATVKARARVAKRGHQRAADSGEENDATRCCLLQSASIIAIYGVVQSLFKLNKC